MCTYDISFIQCSFLRFRSNLREMEALFSEVLSSESTSSSEAGQDGTGEDKKGEADEGVGRRLSHFLFHNMASSLATAPAGGDRPSHSGTKRGLE